MMEPVLTQDSHRQIDGKALGDSVQIELTQRPAPQPLCLAVEFELPPSAGVDLMCDVLRGGQSRRLPGRGEAPEID
jgi:hypothetical protein